MLPNECLQEISPRELLSTQISTPANLHAGLQETDPRTLVANCTEESTTVNASSNSPREAPTHSVYSTPGLGESEADYIADIKRRVMQKWGEEQTNVAWSGIDTQAQAAIWGRVAASCDTFGDAVKRINRLIVYRLTAPGLDERALRKQVLWIDMVRAANVGDLPAVTADELQKTGLIYGSRGILSDARLNEPPRPLSSHPS